MHEGIYNTAELVQQFDDNGNPLYVRFYEDETGAAHKEVLLQNEYEDAPYPHEQLQEPDDHEKLCRHIPSRNPTPPRALSSRPGEMTLSYDNTYVRHLYSMFSSLREMHHTPMQV